MLTLATLDEEALIEAKEEALEVLGLPYESFFEDSDAVTALRYPVKTYPPKVTSAKLDKHPIIEEGLWASKDSIGFSKMAAFGMHARTRAIASP